MIILNTAKKLNYIRYLFNMSFIYHVQVVWERNFQTYFQNILYKTFRQQLVKAIKICHEQGSVYVIPVSRDEIRGGIILMY